MIGRMVFIAKPPDDANMRRIVRLRPTMAIQTMLSEGLRLLADSLEQKEGERANEKPVSFVQAIEQLYG